VGSEKPAVESPAGKLSIFQFLAVSSLKRQCDQIAKAHSDEVHVLAALLQGMIVTYYEDVRRQALFAFFAALFLELIAIGFFFHSASKAMSADTGTVALSAVSGLLIQLITAVVFYLYAQSARQFAAFHTCLERTNRFLLANAMVEHLPEEQRASKRSDVITAIINAPMLTLAMIEKNS
jgi:hypothetical protein